MQKSVQFLIIPGIYNSGEGHWQTNWETIYPSVIRVQQTDWNYAERSSWVDRCNICKIVRKHGAVSS